MATQRPRARGNTARSGALTGTTGGIHSANVAPAPQLNLPTNRSFVGKPGRINLKAVAEVLAARGLDPTEAIVDILRPLHPETGQPTPSALPLDVQARILNELLQYTQPKLKSVEIRAKVAATAFDVSNDQARAIAEEFLRSGAGAAVMAEAAGEDD